MLSFEYRAINAANESVAGLVTAADRQSAMQKLAQESIFVTDLREARRNGAMQASPAQKKIKAPRGLNERKAALLLIQWGRLLTAGLTVDTVLSLSIAGDEKSPVYQLASRMHMTIRSGKSFSEALKTCLPTLHMGSVALIQASEAAGNLALGVARVGEDELRAQQFISELKSALAYPLFVLFTATLVFGILLLGVIPTLETLMKEFGSEPTGLAAMMIGLSNLLRAQWDILMISAGLALGCLIPLWRSPAGLLARDRALLRLPLIGALITSLECYRFSHSLDLMLNGGIRLSSAIPLASQSISNHVLRSEAAGAGKKVLEGVSFGAALEQSRAFPSDLVSLVKTGEKSGNLQVMLSQAAHLYEDHFRQKLKVIMASLTPAITVFLGLVTGLIVLSVVTTVMDLNALALQ